MPAHPRDALHGNDGTPVIAACEHFAGSEKAIHLAMRLQAERGAIFDITCDLDEGAPAGHEHACAQMMADAIASPNNRHHRIGVRIHPHGHHAWKDDVDTVIGACADRVAYVSVPKIDSRMVALQVASYVCHVAEEAGVGRPIPIHVLIAGHGGLRDVVAIAELPVIEGVVFDLYNFVSNHQGAIAEGATESPGQFEHPLVRRAKLEIAAAAHSYFRVPVHNVTTTVDNPERVYADAKRARDEFGYLRMVSIHPTQIEPIVAAMRPAPAAIETAAAIVLSAYHADWAPIRHDGRLHDRASCRYYWQVLARAHATGAAMPEDAHRAFFTASAEGVLQ